MQISHTKRVATQVVGFASAVLLVINTVISSYFLYSLPTAYAVADPQELLSLRPDTVTICHVTPSGQQQELNVNEAALAGHFDAAGNPLHAGDYMGPCVPTEPEDEGDCELVVTKTDNDAQVMPGEEVVYHLTIQNTGNAACEDGLYLKDIFHKDETSFVSASPAATEEPDPDHPRISWLVGVLEPGQSLEVDLTMQVLETVPCDSWVSNYAMWWYSTENYDGEDTEDTYVYCEEEDPETPPAPWCSVLYGVFESAYTPPASYDNPSDINDDAQLSLSDFGLVASMYTPGNYDPEDNEACYLEFDGFDEENYLDIDWCNGIFKGFSDDYYNVSEGDPMYFEPFDLDNDGEIDVVDFALLGAWIGEDNQQACYCQFTDFFPGYGCSEEPPEEAYCGNGEIDNDGEQCDDANTQDGDGCSANCSLENTYQCEDITSQDGWFGEYYNYSYEHPDMDLPGSEWPDNGHGDPLGAWDTDWYTDQYFRFNRVDSNLNFGNDFFPMDMAAEEIVNGHDYHFGVHWRAEVTPPVAGSYNFSLTSDDDAWVYLDGVLVGDNSGIHAPTTLNGSMNLSGSQIVDIFFAERHITQSAMSFSFEDENIDIVPMPEDCQASITVCKYNTQEYPLSGWEMTLYSSNLVTNGDFEYPVVTDHSGQWELFNSAAVDWNVNWVDTEEESEPVLEYQTTLLGTPYSGGQYAELDTNFPVAIDQDIMTTPGLNYELGFAFSPRVGRDLPDNQLHVNFGSVSDTLGADGTANSDTAWTYHLYDFVAVGTTTSLGFTDWGTSNSYGTFVDDVSVRSMTTGVTGENGCVVFEDLPYGTYEIWETMQDGWTQVQPEDGYFTVVLNSENPNQTVNFVNYYDQENPQDPFCGDGVVNQENEYCDDGNNQDGDGCSAQCLIEVPTEPICGDGTMNQESEQCDDGNTESGDGCSNQCLIEESGPEEPQNPPTGGGGGGFHSSGGRAAYCGDDKINRAQEQCDDGNNANGDGCSYQCLTEEVLGEKIVNDQPPQEPVSEAPKGVLGYTELPATGGTPLDSNFIQLLASGLVALYGAALLKIRYYKA